MDYENIGKERLQDLIEEKKSSGVPQKQMALDLGMSESQITKYKNGEIDTLNIQADTLIKLAEYFNVSTDYLLGLQETPTNNKYMDAASEYIGLDLKTTEKIKKLNVEDKKMLELLVRETDFLTFLPKVAAFIETLERTTDSLIGEFLTYIKGTIQEGNALRLARKYDCAETINIVLRQIEEKNGNDRKEK